MSEVLAHMPQTIFINTLFDTQAILKIGKSTDPNKPVGLAHQNMYMVVNIANLVNFQATGDLIIKGKVNDTINWRCASLSGTGDAVFFNKFPNDTAGVIETPRQVQSHPQVAVPKSDNPYSYAFETVTDTFWASSLLKAGETNYKVYFAIQYEDDDGTQKVSYYWWDPKVQVTQ